MTSSTSSGEGDWDLSNSFDWISPFRKSTFASAIVALRGPDSLSLDSLSTFPGFDLEFCDGDGLGFRLEVVVTDAFEFGATSMGAATGVGGTEHTVGGAIVEALVGTTMDGVAAAVGVGGGEEGKTDDTCALTLSEPVG